MSDKDEKIRVLKNVIEEYKKTIEAYELRFHNIIEKNADGILIIDETGKVLYTNPATVDIFGRQHGEFVNFSFGIPAINHGPAEISILHPRKEFRTAEMRVVEIEYESKKAYLASIRDITERRQIEEALKESEEKFRVITMTAMDAIVVIDDKNVVVFSNPAAETIFSYQKDEIFGKPLFSLIAPQRYQNDYQKFLTRLRVKNQGVNKVVELTARKKDGKEFPIEISFSTLKMRGSWHAVCVIRDITEQVRLRKELEKISMVDELTGLLNRRGFFTLANQQLKLSKRRKQLVMLLFMDIDYLKYINDTYGHQEGDRVLITTASILRNTFRESDLIARIGGDEFVLLILDAYSTNDETVILNRLKEHLAHYNAQHKHAYKISLSFGVVISNPSDNTSLDDLLLKADTLMYEQKQTNRKNRLNVPFEKDE